MRKAIEQWQEHMRKERNEKRVCEIFLRKATQQKKLQTLLHFSKNASGNLKIKLHNSESKAGLMEREINALRRMVSEQEGKLLRVERQHDELAVEVQREKEQGF